MQANRNVDKGKSGQSFAASSQAGRQDAPAAVFQLAVEALRRGDYSRAEILASEVLRGQPRHFEAVHLLGLVALQTGRAREGVDLMWRAIAINPNQAVAHSNLAAALLALQQPLQSLASCDRALQLRPDYADAHNNRGNALLAMNRPGDAIASYDRAHALNPQLATILINRGNAQHRIGALQQALDSYDRALQLQADAVAALRGRGDVLRDLDRPEEALPAYDRALQIHPDDAEALNDRGSALLDLGRAQDALDSYEQALRLNPGYTIALNNRSLALRELGRLDEALDSCDRALQLEPDHTAAHHNRGNALQALDRLDEAMASYDRALQIQPDYPNALNNRGNALLELQRPQEALASYEQALQLKPDYAEASYNRANALRALKRLDEALAGYEEALRLKPGLHKALNNHGNLLLEMRRHEESARSMARLIEAVPGYDYALGSLLHARRHCCDWADYAETAERLSHAVEQGLRADTPFSMLTVSDSPALQQRCARSFVEDRFPAAPALWTGERYRHDKIRLAYVSADFRDHPVSYLMAGLFEQHSRDRFETWAISLRPEENSATGQRVKAAFDHFIDVSGRGDREVAELMRAAEIDIAVDLMGYTQGMRTAIFAQRPVPLQVNYLGFAGTMGAAYIDYILADRIVIPPEQQRHYTEQVVYLPDSYQPNDSTRRIAQRTPTRAEAMLPESGLVFCCFNNHYKITPQVFDIWMRLLHRVEGSVLWLAAGTATVEQNLRREAAQRGVDAGRLVFAPRLPDLQDHLARYRLADLFLDTLPFNAHTTASDALWAGLPVLTCIGGAFPGRVAASQLTALGLPELVAPSLDEYEALALRLANAPPLLAGLRARLAANRTTHPLFDTQRFRRHIEAAYITMWQRQQRGEMPASFAVPQQPADIERTSSWP